jgi:hypothetical protein
MKIAVHKFTAIGLALLFLGLPTVLSARERRGANIVITLKDGQQVEGELIVVKSDSLLLLNPAGKDESVDLVGIRRVTIVRESKAGLGAVCGLLAGVAGTIIYASTKKATDVWASFFEGLAVAGAAVVFPVTGLGLGIGAGVLAGKDKTIQLEGKSESDRAIVLDRLRRKARIRN